MEGPFEQVVFSGGGLRCFWQGGFVSAVDEALGLSPSRISGVSGGALAGSAWLAGRERDLLERMASAFEQEDWHATLEDLDESHGRTPHQRVYDSVVRDVLDKTAAAKIADGPSFQILIGHPPTNSASGLTGAAMTFAYEAELHIVNAPHFNWAEKMGMTVSFVDARDAARSGKLADLVIAAATIPPIFRTPEWDGRRVIDGGMADQAPMPEPDDGPTLVLLTRQYRRLPDVPGRLYVAPSKETPADKIDFTDPAKLRETWSLGEKDGEKFLNERNKGKEI
ncbi:MAG: patatin-like phospholipase family protein [Silicimonas sp.]|nr:patatin-like phospholipase family protein [Silicimonas sp.]